MDLTILVYAVLIPLGGIITAYLLVALLLWALLEIISLFENTWPKSPTENFTHRVNRTLAFSAPILVVWWLALWMAGVLLYLVGAFSAPARHMTIALHKRAADDTSAIK